MLQSFLHFLHALFDAKELTELIRRAGPPLICAIVFVETGLFVGFFLPGDSLLITAGTTPIGSASWPPCESRASLSPPGALFPPDDTDATEHVWLTALRRLANRINPARRLRAAPRVIKRKMPKWHVKRAHHAAWPHPQCPPTYIIGST